MDDIFTRYYETNFWKGKDSVSGPGSDLNPTQHLRDTLPRVIKQLNVESMLDISCGDFYWMSHIKEIQEIEYIGADVVPALIRQNRERYVHPNWEFQVFDATRDRLPPVDLIFCRDTLVHLNEHAVLSALKNFRASGSTWLLATTFPGAVRQDINTGEWRAMDLSAWRYNLGQPVAIFEEHSTPKGGEFSNKSLGLWRIDQ